MIGPAHRAIFGTTANPCPWWCDLPAGHGYDTYDDGGHPTRVHSNSVGTLERADLGETHVYVEAGESLRIGPTGTEILLGPAACSVAEAEVLEPEEAARLAVLLTAAADLIARIRQEIPGDLTA